MRWKVLPPAPAEHLSLYANIPSLLAQLLYNRGVTDPRQAELFLTADRQLENDPRLLPDMAKAVARIIRAVLGGETIAVFGDFDADGVTSTALLVQGLQKMGGNVISYIPHRVDEGHGLNVAALQNLHKQGASLVVTVDCGVTAYAEAETATQMGLDLIITDHHEVTGTLPRALAVVNPKRPDSAYPCRDLAGVGVAFKLLQALFRATGRDDQSDTFLDLVALGTVADMSPLLSENRYLVKQGLEALNITNCLGIRAMIASAGKEMGQLNAETISYVLAPRLNAAGRLDHASVSYDLLMTNSTEKARQLAAILEARNIERQQMTSQFMTLAEQKLSPIDPAIALLIVDDTEFHAGVNGVVAGKLTDKYYRPAVVIDVGEEESMGSARSIPEFNIVAALAECQDLLSHFGGHARAAGFGVTNKNIDPLRQRLLQIAKRELTGIDLQPTINVDAEVSLAALGGRTLDLISRLEPFGQENPSPTFLSRGVKVVGSRQVGSDGEHIKLKLNDKGTIWDAIGFGLNYLNEDNPPLIDIVYNLKLNKWMGRESLELEILDFAPSQ
ncbi:MAG: single-stranded-DNA-specific exonuclease RecJ [Dehalococcoidia bacterium]|nr:single-stranded-DNA-specific exonuclease RecJ [Dehalococcoidia bacterium]